MLANSNCAALRAALTPNSSSGTLNGRTLLRGGRPPSLQGANDDGSSTIGGGAMHQVPSSTLTGPDHLELQLTTACQYRCAYCGSPDGRPPHQADRHALEDLIREIRPSKVSFTGGEPTLAWGLLMDLVRCAASVGCLCQLNTNCRALTRERVRELEENGLTILHASLSTLDARLFARIRRARDPEGLEHIRRVVSFACGRSRMRVIVEAMLTRDTLAGLQDVYEFALDAGAESFELQAVIPTSDAMWAVVPEDYELVNAVDVLIALRSNELPITLCCLHLPDCKGYERWSNQDGVERHRCGCGRETVYVAADGTVMPCSFFHEELGNARDGLKEIWRSSPLLERIRSERPEACGACDSWDDCRNTCPALVYRAAARFDELAHDAHDALRSRVA
ncbi:MAG: radical SAM protein [Candidatus Eisenbacteria bacterium]|nr:radical SAM protein [Candidatus Eisenbacteria bacterium]